MTHTFWVCWMSLRFVLQYIESCFFPPRLDSLLFLAALWSRGSCRGLLPPAEIQFRHKLYETVDNVRFDDEATNGDNAP